MTPPSAPDPEHLDAAIVAPDRWQRRTTLRDGTKVLLRQIRPQDRDRLVAGLSELSPASRYLRFHEDLTEFSPEQLRYLTEIDHVDHEAIVALDLDRPEHPGVGVARYIREPFDRQVAEVAVTVADRYHGRGAATLLLGALAARAGEEDVEVFRHYVLAGNEAMLEVLHELGASGELEADGVWQVDLQLPQRPSDLPDSPAGRTFMAAAKEHVRLASLLRPVLKLLAFAPETSRPDDIASGSGPEERDDELTRWLADREQRAAHWPAGSDGTTTPSPDGDRG